MSGESELDGVTEAMLLEKLKEAAAQGIKKIEDLPDPELREETHRLVYGNINTVEELVKIEGIDTSSLQRAIRKYWWTVKCSYCSAVHAYNLLNGIVFGCPSCNRRGDTFNFNPPTAATWLMGVYRFANIIESDYLYVYNEESGIWEGYAEALIKAELDKVAHKHTTSHKANETIASIKAGSGVRIDAFAGATLQTVDDVKFNLQNGVYSLKDEKLLPHAPDYHFLGRLPIIYNPDARPTQTLKFLEECHEPHYDSYLNQLEHVAFTLCPGYHINKAIMDVGSGGNGKSTWLKRIKAFLGQANVSSITLQQLDEERFLRAGLFGKMANISADIPKDALKYTGFFKMTTGGDLITAENKNKNPFQFMSTAKQFYSANEIPISEDKSLAFFERWSITEWFKEFREGENDDTGLINKLVTDEENSGLFNLIVNIVPILLQRNKFTFDKTTSETETLYKERSNSAESFIETCLKADPGSQLLSTEIVHAYNEYCSDTGLLQETDKRLFSTLKDSPLHPERRRKQIDGVLKWFYVGITLIGKNDQATLADAEEDRRASRFNTMEGALNEWVDRNQKYDEQYGCRHIQHFHDFLLTGFLQGSQDKERLLKNAGNRGYPVNLQAITNTNRILTEVQEIMEIVATLSTSQGSASIEATEFRANGAPSTYENSTISTFIHTSTPSVWATTLSPGCEASPVSVCYGDGAGSFAHLSGADTSSASGQPTNAKATLLNTGGVEVLCPTCGSQTGRLWEYGGKWMCTDCLNAEQHKGDDPAIYT